MTLQNNGANFLRTLFLSQTVAIRYRLASVCVTSVLADYTHWRNETGQTYLPHSLIFIRAEYTGMFFGEPRRHSTGGGQTPPPPRTHTVIQVEMKAWIWPHDHFLGLTCCYWLMRCHFAAAYHRETIPPLRYRCQLSNSWTEPCRQNSRFALEDECVRIGMY